MKKVIISFFIVSVLVTGITTKGTTKMENNQSENIIFKSYEGVICVQTSLPAVLDNWVTGSNYTGKGIKSTEIPLAGNFAEFTINAKNAGTYELYVLGNRKFNLDSKDCLLHVYTSAAEEKFTEKALIKFNDMNPPSWTHTASDNSSSLLYLNKGINKIRIAMDNVKDVYVEKILLTNSGYVPTGEGPEGTTEDNIKQGKIYLGGFDSMVVMPPAWAFGCLYSGYTNQQETIDTISKVISEDFPIDAYWIDSWFWNFKDKGAGPQGYLGFVEDKSAYPDVAKMWSDMKNLDVKAGIWVWDRIQEPGQEAKFAEYKNNDYFKSVYNNNDSWHNKNRPEGGTPTGNINFSDPKAVAAWKKDIKPFFDKGVDFLKIDSLTYIDYTKAAFEVSQEFGKETQGRGFVLAHTHSVYDPRFKLYPTIWTDDSKICWTQPEAPITWGWASYGGLKENVEYVADSRRSTYEVPFLTNDTGGYDYYGSTEQSDELFIRWAQFSLMNSLFEICTQYTNATHNLPTSYPENIQKIFRKYAHLRMELFPYIYTYALGTRVNGKKIVQGDGIHNTQYLFGDEMLVAPVVEQSVVTKDVYLPEGEWINFDTGKKYEGNQTVTVDAPLDIIPIFIRSGAIIPMRDYARTIELGTNDKLNVEIYPGNKKSSFTLLEDDGLSNDYLKGAFASTEMSCEPKKNFLKFHIEPVNGDYAGMSAERTWVLNFHIDKAPLNCTVNGKNVNIELNAKTKIATVTFKADKKDSIIVMIGR